MSQSVRRNRRETKGQVNFPFHQPHSSLLLSFFLSLSFPLSLFHPASDTHFCTSSLIFFFEERHLFPFPAVFDTRSNERNSWFEKMLKVWCKGKIEERGRGSNRERERENERNLKALYTTGVIVWVKLQYHCKLRIAILVRRTAIFKWTLSSFSSLLSLLLFFPLLSLLLCFFSLSLCFSPYS